MVIKGGSRSGGGDLAAHLLRTDTNERAEVLELHGVIADQLLDALREMEAVATGTRCQKPLYHASINTGPGEELTAEQKAIAIARLEKALGLEGHARAVVEHRKEGRDHLHVVWSRIDGDTMRATRDSHNYRKHEEAARELEREFGHNRVQGAHVERDDQPRPPRTPSPGDMQQATRTKRELADVTAEITRLWRAADTGPAFAAALEGAGYVLAQGDRRGYCVVDDVGGVHSLAKRIEGANTKEVNARLAGIELASLPTADQARAMQRDRQMPGNERPGWRLALELTRPLGERHDRTMHQAAEEHRYDTARQQIRADIDQHARDQADKRPQAPETGRGEAKVPPAPEAAPEPAQPSHTPPERRDGPDLQQQLADSAEYRRERAQTDRANDNRPTRSTVKPETVKAAGRTLGRGAGLLGTGLGKAAGGLLGLLGAIFRAGGAVENAVTSKPDPRREREQAPSPPPPVRAQEPRAAAPAKPAAPRPPSVFDEIQGKIREQQVPGGKAPPPQPEKDRGRGMECRPLTRLIGALGEYVGWAVEAKRRLEAYGFRTGDDVTADLKELDRVIYFAGHSAKPRYGEGWAI